MHGKFKNSRAIFIMFTIRENKRGKKINTSVQRALDPTDQSASRKRPFEDIRDIKSPLRNDSTSCQGAYKCSPIIEIIKLELKSLD